MKPYPPNNPSKSPWTFFALVFTISIPFWLLGAVVEQLLPADRLIDLPIGSLAVASPTIAALILVHRENGSEGMKRLLTITAAIVIYLWGPATLARYRFARLGQDVQPRAVS
jgi:hypothetical protein